MVSNSMAMLEPPFHMNPLTRLWRTLDANIALARQFPKYIKLAQLAIIHVLGSVEDERCFSSLTFLKDKLRNRLASNHHSLVMEMYAQDVFTLQNFLYDPCFQSWVHSAERYYYGILAQFVQCQLMFQFLKASMLDFKCTAFFFLQFLNDASFSLKLVKCRSSSFLSIDKLETLQCCFISQFKM